MSANPVTRKRLFGRQGYIPNAQITHGRVGFGFYACFRFTPWHAVSFSHGLGWRSTFKVWRCGTPVKDPKA